VAASGERRRTARAWLRLGVLGLAVAYPLALVLVLAVLRGIGERWTLSTIALYLPRAAFGLPLPLLTLALLLCGVPRRWLATQLVAALVLLFPLMGLELHGRRAVAADAAPLRVLSCNVDLGSALVEEVAAAIRAAAPDLALLQEAPPDELERLSPLLPGYVLRADDQFVIASKYPIIDAYLAPPTTHDGVYFRPAFARYRVEAPGGPIDVYDVHPLSPHDAFGRLWGDGLLHEIASGRLFVNRDGFRRVAENTAVRTRQVRAIAAHARAAPFPVIVAGDTNLPSGSPLLARELGAYDDGFEEVGWGFGYTFPAHRAAPWLRLDRVMADRRFRFVSLSRLDVHVSKHFPIVADLERTQKNQWAPHGGQATEN
jgi:endonuclease/exonuclease/phosphatase (EEP) superfamily protein YafD